MSTYTQLCYHIVFSTKERRPVLCEEHRDELLKYMWGVVKEKQGHLYRINATADHVHLLTSVHPTVAMADFIKDLKLSSSKWMKGHAGFSGFDHWQGGYSDFTHSKNERNGLIEYVKGQAEHHHKKSFIEELRELLVEAGIDFEERYLG
jgi:putative transposase